MAMIEFTTDVAQGFGLKAGSRANVGHLVAATFAGAALSPDFTVIDPMTKA